MKRTIAVVGLVVMAGTLAACSRPGGPPRQAVDRHFSVTLFKKHATQDKCDVQVSDTIRVVEGDTLSFDVMNLCDYDKTVDVRWAGSGADPNDAPSNDTPSANVPANQTVVTLRAAIKSNAADHSAGTPRPKTYHYNFRLTGQNGRDPDIVVDYAP